jgi:hypothetical protein
MITLGGRRHARHPDPVRHGPSGEGTLEHTTGDATKHPLLRLHGVIGNRAVQRLVDAGCVQRSLTMTDPDDPDELEAGRLADQVMRKSEGAVDLPSGEAAGGAGVEVPPIVHAALGSPGQPLDAATRAFMEPRFGRDLSHVRVHQDQAAAVSARAVNASAYTVGRDVVFGAGRYAPHSESGRRLLAHELTHVVQQARGAVVHRLQRHADTPCLPCTQVSAKDKAVWMPANDIIERAYRDDRAHREHCVLYGSQFEYGGTPGKVEISVPKGCPNWDLATELVTRLRGVSRQLAPDIMDFTARVFYEIKTPSGAGAGAAQLLGYYKLANSIIQSLDPDRAGPQWRIEAATWYPPHMLPLPGSGVRFVCTQLTDYKLSGTPGLIVYTVHECEKKDDEEKKKQKQVVEKPVEKPIKKTAPPAITYLAPELRQWERELRRELPQRVAPAAPGQRFVVVMGEKLWTKLIGDERMERQMDLMRVHGMDPKRNPVIGFRNLGWTLVGIYAGSMVVVYAAGAVGLAGVGAAGTAAVGATEVAAGGAAAAAVTEGGTAITATALRALGTAAANDNAIAQLAKVAAVIAVGVAASESEASAATPTYSWADAIAAVPMQSLSADEQKYLSDGSEVSINGRRFYVVGFAKVTPGAE